VNILKRTQPELLVSKQKLRQAEVVELVRLKRETVTPNVGFASRPFVFAACRSSGHPKEFYCTSVAMDNFFYK